MNGDAPYLAKIAHVLFAIDSMVGKDFEAVRPTRKPSPNDEPSRQS
jgi:hypothetical protein